MLDHILENKNTAATLKTNDEILIPWKKYGIDIKEMTTFIHNKTKHIYYAFLDKNNHVWIDNNNGTKPRKLYNEECYTLELSKYGPYQINIIVIRSSDHKVLAINIKNGDIADLQIRARDISSSDGGLYCISWNNCHEVYVLMSNT